MADRETWLQFAADEGGGIGHMIPLRHESRFAAAPVDLGRIEARAFDELSERLIRLSVPSAIAHSIVDDAARRIAALYDASESPIERAIAPWLICGNFLPLALYGPAILQDLAAQSHGLGIVPQCRSPYGPYRLDFALVWNFGNQRRIVALECDGKDFHDPTRDAARDQALACQGIATIRAPGEVIYRDPRQIIRDLLTALCS